LFEVENLTVYRGDKAVVHGLSFTVSEGSIVGLLGPNGAGKTTAICGLLGLLRSSSDRLSLNDVDLRDHPKERRARLGYVPQAVAMYPELSVVENLKIWGGLYGIGDQRIQKRVEFAIELAGLQERGKDRVHALSGGMKRRLNLAIGLLHDPDVLICDEPTTGVDAESRRAIYRALHEMKEAGKHVLYTTHYFKEVEDLCDRVVILQEGKMVLQDSLDALLSAKEQGENTSIAVQTSLSSQELEEAMTQAGIPFSQTSLPKPSLEEVFLKVTQNKGVEP